MKSRSFKDFFHDINDILLAVVIVLIAAIIIAWRFNVIMDYPEKISAQNAANAEAQQEIDDQVDPEDPEAPVDEQSQESADSAEEDKAPSDEEVSKANG